MIVEELKKSLLYYAFSGKLIKSNLEVDIENILNQKTSEDWEYSTKQKIQIRNIERSEEPFNLPRGWKWIRLHEVCSYIQRGKSPKYSKIEKIPVIAQKCNQWDKLHIDKCLFIDPDDVKKYTKERFLIDEDILINSTGGGSCGRIGIYNSRLNPYDIAVADSHITVCRPYKDIILSKFIYYYMISPTVQSVIESQAVGTTNQIELMIDTIRNYLIPYTDIDTQRKIVNKIEELFSKLDEIKIIEDELIIIKNEFSNEIKKSIILSAISGKLSYQNEYEKIDIQQIKDITKVLEPYPIPKNWIWLGHNDLFEVIGGSQPPKSRFSNTLCEGFIQLYQTRDYGSNPQPIYVDKNDVSKFTKKGDIILARYGGSLGKVFWAEDGAYNVALAKVVLKYHSLINIKYLYYYYLGDLYQSKVKNGNRSAQAGFSKDDLNDLQFPLPPIEEQQRIVDKLELLLPICDDIKKLMNE